jgi:hypothetical protein
MSFLSSILPLTDPLKDVYRHFRNSKRAPKVSFTAFDNVHVYVNSPKDPKKISFYVSIVNSGYTPLRESTVETLIQIPRIYDAAGKLIVPTQVFNGKFRQDKFDILPHPYGESPFLTVMDIERTKDRLKISSNPFDGQEEWLIFDRSNNGDFQVVFEYDSQRSGPNVVDLKTQDLVARIGVMVTGTSDTETVAEEKAFEISSVNLGNSSCNLADSSIREIGTSFMRAHRNKLLTR